MTSSGITVSTNQRGTGRPELVLRVCLCVCSAKKNQDEEDLLLWKEKKGKMSQCRDEAETTRESK